MHLTRTPHTHHAAPCATKAPPKDTAALHPPRAQQELAQHTHDYNDFAPIVVESYGRECSATHTLLHLSEQQGEAWVVALLLNHKSCGRGVEE